jgi:hypothetical protein
VGSRGTCHGRIAPQVPAGVNSIRPGGITIGTTDTKGSS